MRRSFAEVCREASFFSTNLSTSLDVFELLSIIFTVNLFKTIEFGYSDANMRKALNCGSDKLNLLRGTDKVCSIRDERDKMLMAIFI